MRKDLSSFIRAYSRDFKLFIHTISIPSPLKKGKWITFGWTQEALDKLKQSEQGVV